ncbi:MAG: hypothetical protein JST92_03610, partial [Deltaproteobacteria bacterium]|nr:hypothetical protein [Deltaproteobacteria bacterium]
MRRARSIDLLALLLALLAAAAHAQLAPEDEQPALDAPMMVARARGGLPGGALTLEADRISVDIDHQFATTTLAQTWHSTMPVDVEGSYTLQTHVNASVMGYAYWNGEEKIVGEVFEKQTARQLYDDTTRLQRDPGLLEETGAGRFSFAA